MSFKYRSYDKELLDGNNIPFADIRRNMQELDYINRHLGGHRITITGIKRLQRRKKTQLSVVEIGCGGGDNLRVIKQWCDAEGIRATLTGIDINNDCVQYARSQTLNESITFICSDYQKVFFDKKPDIIFSSLFCHHFHEQELVLMMQWMNKNCTIGFLSMTCIVMPWHITLLKHLPVFFQKATW